MDDPKEHGLVVKALTSGLSNCVLWKNARTEHRIQNAPSLLGWTPKAIKQELIRCVRNAPVLVRQVQEDRPEYKSEYERYYDVILPVDGFTDGLYIEMVLHDDDEDCPVVLLVNAHPQISRKRF